MNITIPAFVPRGLAAMSDPTNLAEPGIRYGKEEHLRDAMAAIWWLHGWVVRTEVKVPDCGRIDVLAEMGDARVIIELKKAITTPTQARQAFQQAHAYKAYLESEPTDLADRRRFTAMVTAGNYSYPAVEAAERAYFGVYFHPFMVAAEQATNPDPWLRITPDALATAAHISRHRERQLAVLASAARSASAMASRAREQVARHEEVA